MEAAIETFHRLADRIGPERFIWRYDPIVLSSVTDSNFHRERYAWLARRLRGYTTRSVISFMDVYKKAAPRLRALAAQGVTLPEQPSVPLPGYNDLLHCLVETAAQNAMEIVSCAEEADLTGCGVNPGKCVDDALIELSLIHI